jgi:hypothetical protein
MASPANNDFAVTEADLFVYVRPFTDYLSFRIQSRELNHIRINWQETVFTDIVGRKYAVVPPTVNFEEAVYGIPPLDVPPGEVWKAKLLLLDPANRAEIQRLGGRPSPVVPVDAGTLEQMRGQLFHLDLELELNNTPRNLSFEFEIRDAFYR